MKIKMHKLLFSIFLFSLQSMSFAQNKNTSKFPVLPDNVEVSYSDSNPLKDALKPVPATAVFEMDGWSLWDPSVIKVGDTYNLFCSRWREKDGWDTWKHSQIIRATSKCLFGPYKFQEIVMEAKNHPWAKQGLHNPKIIKVGNKFLIYHLAIPQWKTGFLFADKIEGPWTPSAKPMVYTNNPALMVRKDGSVYVVGKFKVNDPDKKGKKLFYMNAFEAKSILGPFKNISGNEDCLPGGFELEDPTIWWANNQYNLICTDWKAKATGIFKAIVMYTSKDGIHYKLFSQIPTWTRYEPIPVEGWNNVMPKLIERPQVYINENGALSALLVSAVKQAKPDQGIILIRPVDNFIPQNK